VLAEADASLPKTPEQLIELHRRKAIFFASVNEAV
jgi:hypothetical protein